MAADHAMGRTLTSTEIGATDSGRGLQDCVQREVDMTARPTRTTAFVGAEQ